MNVKGHFQSKRKKLKNLQGKTQKQEVNYLKKMLLTYLFVLFSNEYN